MGFTTGFLGGLTLTYSVLYLSLYLHRANRGHQRTLLSQQSELLSSITIPPSLRSQPSVPPATRQTEYERRSASLADVLKGRWNEEVAGTMRKVQETDWARVRERWTHRGVIMWKNLTGE